ncbi:MAG: hypothetical protein AB1736_01005 [Chloroflexota bacterium]
MGGAFQDLDTGTRTAIRLRVARVGDYDLDTVRHALADLGWLGRPADGPPGRPEMRRIATDLELAVRDGSAPGPVRKSALIDLGQPQVQDAGLSVAVSWQSATLAPLFPVFVGHLRVGRGRLIVEGRYTPPFGRIGLVIDATLLHFVARRTAQAFLARVAARFGEEPPARASGAPGEGLG